MRRRTKGLDQPNKTCRKTCAGKRSKIPNPAQSEKRRYATAVEDRIDVLSQSRHLVIYGAKEERREKSSDKEFIPESPVSIHRNSPFNLTVCSTCGQIGIYSR